MPTKKEDTPWFQAIIQVMKDAGKPMHYKEIAQTIIDRKLRTNVGATPTYTVNANITWYMKHRPDTAPFIRVDKGIYALREGSTVSGKSSLPEPPPDAEKESTEESAGVIQAFGMFWQRNKVHWKNGPALIGKQLQGATQVDFADQRGVYILHDGPRVIYVGQVLERSLGQRLFEHTADRLNGRWDRFSWFGIRRVTSDGKLVDSDFSHLSVQDIVTTLEALLIEGLEPPQNRRRGDDFSDVEYIQIEDPAIQRKQKDALVKEMVAKL